MILDVKYVIGFYYMTLFKASQRRSYIVHGKVKVKKSKKKAIDQVQHF